MKEYESFNIENENKFINEDNADIINRYEVDNPELKDSFILQKINLNKKKQIFPPLFYIFFFSLILLIGVAITYLIEYIIKEKNYTEYKEPYLKPYISHHTYTKYVFDNNLTLLLIQVNQNDLAWGTIAFDTGYLDTKYNPGILNFAIKSLINYNIREAIELKDYNGDFDSSVDEFYSTISFKIMNSGFSKYLKIFSRLTSLNEEMIKNNFENTTKSIKSEVEKNKNILTQREKHLMEYLIYGYTKNGNEILPQVIDEKVDNETIINVVKSLLNPSKIKIVLASHFKVSLMKKLFLNYFKDIINTNKQEGKIINDYNISDFTKQKMIYLKIRDYETNYMKINYYLEKNVENDLNIYIETGYLNYIKFILNETNEGSLYYNLRKKYKIIELSSDFEVILKNKIRFTIYISLSSYSFNNNINEIRNDVYQYMNELKNYIITLDNEDNRVKDLYHIIKQNFTFLEDVHGEFSDNKEKAINLFIKDQKIYYLRKKWVPSNFTYRLDDMKEYINQLSSENSVVLICLNNEIIEKYYNKTIFGPNEFYQTKYYNLNYSIINLDIDFKENISNETYNFTYHSSKYISEFTEKSKIEYNPNDRDNYYNTKHQKLPNTNGSLTDFYYLRDTSFKLPKVYITLNVFHPFQRSNDKDKDYHFFEIMLYMAYLKREINFNLADAIHAGNIFKVFFNQNLFYIDIFAYFDIVKDLLIKVKEIILNVDYFKGENSLFYQNFEIYKEIVLNDLLNVNFTDNTDRNLRLSFYQILTNDSEKNLPPIYNYFSFPREKFLNLKEEDKIKICKDMKFITFFFIQGYLYGYIDRAKNDEEKINGTNVDSLYDIFKDIGSNFNYALQEANLINPYLNSSNYIEWIKHKNLLDKNEIKEINISNCDNNTVHRFMYFSEYNLKNYLISSIFQKVIDESKSVNYLKLSHFTQGEIYYYFTIKSNENNNIPIDKIINNGTYLKDAIIKILGDNRETYESDIDTIGNRFYYLVLNKIYSIYSRSEDLRGRAIEVGNSNFYKGEPFGVLIENKEMDYDDFIQIIIKFFKKINYFVDYKCSSK